MNPDAIITELLEAIQQRSIITAIQHFGKSGEKQRLMKARRAAEALLNKGLRKNAMDAAMPREIDGRIPGY